VGFSATAGSKTPEPIDTKLGVRNYVGDITLSSKYGSDLLHKKVPFGGLDDEYSHLPPFLSQHLKICITANGNFKRL